MTAQEWLRQKFHDDGETFSLGPLRVGLVSVFLSLFGSTIQAALDAGRNPVDDLCALPEAEKRGWGPDFDEWKVRGI